MNGKSFQIACALCVALGFNAQRAHGQALDLLIDQKLKNTSAFTQFATFYGRDNCQLFIETAKEDRQATLDRFEEINGANFYTYHTPHYKIEIIRRNVLTGMDLVRINKI